jgi:hypothetical protein
MSHPARPLSSKAPNKRRKTSSVGEIPGIEILQFTGSLNRVLEEMKHIAVSKDGEPLIIEEVENVRQAYLAI